MEFSGSDANDREWLLVQIDRFANDSPIAAKMRAPEGIAQNDVGRGIGTALVVRIEESAEFRLHA